MADTWIGGEAGGEAKGEAEGEVKGAGEGTRPAPDVVTGDPLWDDWTVAPRVPRAPALHLDGFDGPIDLLLDLAEHQRIDLGRVSIVHLAEQFVAALARLGSHVPIERRADWVVMASRLVLLRSRLLFPDSGSGPAIPLWTPVVPMVVLLILAALLALAARSGGWRQTQGFGLAAAATAFVTNLLTQFLLP